jgi:AcrR family transcriptional regulator
VNTQKALTANQQERRQRILDATRESVARHGYEGTIMRDVAVAAGVSPTTIYNLYNTKDELMFEALRERVLDGQRETARRISSPGFDRLIGQLSTSVAQTRAEPAYAEAIVLALNRAQPNDPIIDILYLSTEQAVLTSLQAMQDQGDLRADANMQTLARSLVASFWAGYGLWSKGLLELSSLEDELTRGYLSALLPVSRGIATQRIERLLRPLL